MTELFNKKNLKETRRYLRTNMSKAEAILWKYLSRKQIKGQRFLRQFSIDKYIVDFYCQKLKLVIEADGSTHFSDEEIKNDKIRQKEIEKLGIIFLRFSNNDVIESIDSVIKRIELKVEELMSNPLPPFRKVGTKDILILIQLLYNSGITGMTE